MMKEKMNVTGKDRRVFADRIAEITGDPVKYLGVPSCSYQVGEFILTKDGYLETENDEEGRKLMEKLGEPGDEMEEPVEEKDDGTQRLELSFPNDLTDDQLVSLKMTITAKSELIKSAFRTESTDIRVTEEKITFPWFKVDSSYDESMTYMLFLTKLLRFIKGLKRANNVSPERPVNEKYAFRCFLLRLGFIGDDYKGARKILLRNLKGSSAFSKQEVKE